MNKLQSNSRDLPWHWVLLMAAPAGMYAFLEKCSGTAAVFSLKKFTCDPQTIALVTSVNVLFGILLAPLASWLSDKYNCRRKPFMIPGLSLLAVCLVLLPSANSLTQFVVVFVICQICVDVGFNGPWSPLYADIVPPTKRSLGMVFNHYSAVLARLFFMFFLIGRFDKSGRKHAHMNDLASTAHTHSKNIFSLSGEQLIYYIAALLVVITIIFLLVFVKEEKNYQAGSEKYGVKDFCRLVASNSLYKKLYLLFFAAALMRVKLGSLWPLMVTEQFHLSKQSLGNIHSATMIISLILILPLAALLIKKADRWKVFLGCVIVSTCQPILLWTTVHFFYPQPTTLILIIFQIIDAAADNIGYIVLWPLVFEIIPAGKRGVMNAGLLLITGVTVFIMSNVIAAFVKYISTTANDSCPYSEGLLVVCLAGVVATVITYCSRPSS